MFCTCFICVFMGFYVCAGKNMGSDRHEGVCFNMETICGPCI